MKETSADNIVYIGNGEIRHLCTVYHLHWYNWSARLCSWINKMLDEVK
jgi:hypothetical protein